MTNDTCAVRSIDVEYGNMTLTFFDRFPFVFARPLALFQVFDKILELCVTCKTFLCFRKLADIVSDTRFGLPNPGVLCNMDVGRRLRSFVYRYTLTYMPVHTQSYMRTHTFTSSSLLHIAMQIHTWTSKYRRVIKGREIFL